MRITGGAARGRRLRSPSGPRVRPTGDRIREAIFDILATRTDLEGKRLLDLFAGTGSLGLEALSRGAREVVFVDRSAQSCRIARENAGESGFASKAKILCRGLPEGLGRLPEGAFDGAFLDPPYEKGLVRRTLGKLGDESLLRLGGWVVAESSVREETADRYGSLASRGRWKYGSTVVTLYEKEVEA